jgi:hypothetical protein
MRALTSTAPSHAHALRSCAWTCSGEADSTMWQLPGDLGCGVCRSSSSSSRPVVCACAWAPITQQQFLSVLMILHAEDA